MVARWLLGGCHGGGDMVLILVPWYFYWCHGIYIGVMVFVLVPW